MSLEFHSNKGIKNWIQAAMAKSNESIHLERIVQVDACVAVADYLSVLQNWDEDGYIVRHPANKEHGHDAQDELHCSASGVRSGPPDFPQYSYVAKDCHNKSNPKENILLRVTNDFPPGGVELAALAVFVLVMNANKWGEEQGRHGCANADNPKQETHTKASLGRVHTGVRERVDNRNVPVDGHGGQEQDTAVEARVEDKGHNFAEELRKQPPPDVVHHIEGKAGREDEVRQGQVQDQNVGEVAHEVFVKSQDGKDESVSHQA